MYAFFVASTVNVVTWFTTIHIREDFFELFNISIEEFPGIVYVKVWEATLVVGMILVLVKLSGGNSAPIHLRKGNLKWAMRISVLALMNLMASSFLIATSIGRDLQAIKPLLPPMVAFSLANGFMEELWFRGLM